MDARRPDALHGSGGIATRSGNGGAKAKWPHVGRSNIGLRKRMQMAPGAGRTGFNKGGYAHLEPAWHRAEDWDGMGSGVNSLKWQTRLANQI